MKNARRSLSFAAAAVQSLGCCLLSLAGVAGAVAVPARANALRPATSLVGCSATTATPGFVQDPAFCSLGIVERATASATLPFITLSATALSPAGARSAQANAGATYFFQVTGGIAGDVVPLLIETTLTTVASETQSPRSYASASVATFTTILGHTVAGPQVCTYVAACQSFVTSFSGTIQIEAASGSVGDFINLTAFASAASGINGVVDEWASAFVDPYIYVDPAFPNASLYSVIVSPGVDNSPFASTPEPASAVLMGFGVLFCAIARPARNRKTDSPPLPRSHMILL